MMAWQLSPNRHLPPGRGEVFLLNCYGVFNEKDIVGLFVGRRAGPRRLWRQRQGGRERGVARQGRRADYFEGEGKGQGRTRGHAAAAPAAAAAASAQVRSST